MLFDRDEQALTIADDKYGSLCQKLAYKIIGDYDEANECVNNSLFQLWNAIPPARPKSLKAYLCGIVRNVAINVGRKRKSYNETQTNFSELADIFCDSHSTETTFGLTPLSSGLSKSPLTDPAQLQKVFLYLLLASSACPSA